LKSQVSIVIMFIELKVVMIDSTIMMNGHAHCNGFTHVFVAKLLNIF
jgi:hypothetical protein